MIVVRDFDRLKGKELVATIGFSMVCILGTVS